MEMELIRRHQTEKSTQGCLYIDGKKECFTLEPAIPIPEGTYTVTLYASPRFRMLLPLLIRVPGYEYIEIHPGNFPQDTEGCILPGLTKDTDYVGQSRIAFNRLMGKVKKAMATLDFQGQGETVSITIRTELRDNVGA